jgi:hypothetical protein
VGELGLVILGLWLLTLLTPESLLFATGDLRRLLDLPTPLQFNPPASSRSRPPSPPASWWRWGSPRAA